MGKFTANPQKLGTIVQYLQSSRVAHSIKDLEKHLPGVASINGMQVKESKYPSHYPQAYQHRRANVIRTARVIDYLQSLSDDSRIHVEKIGSGNWYWSFALDEVSVREKTLNDMRAAHLKISSAVAELQARIAETKALVRQEAEQSETREELLARKACLDSEQTRLRGQLERYRNSDPAELNRMRTELEAAKGRVDSVTDEIYAMEGWFRKMGQDEEGLKILRESLYGEELDEEAGGLKELPT